jgi:acyl carrier protein
MTSDGLTATSDRLHDDMLRIWRRLLQVDDLSIDDDFFERGGDSLQATEMMLELQRLTGTTAPETLLFEASTIRTLAERLTRAEAPKRAIAVRLGAAGGGATPLVFFHGDVEGGGVYVKQLADKLGPDQPLIVIAPHVLGVEPIPASIEGMAEDRLPAILREQPHGPYRLAGFCLGGVVALETARLLLAQGHQVETVVMIDSPVMANGEPLTVQRHPASDAAVPSDDPQLADDDPAEAIWKLFGDLLEQYHLEKLAVPLLLFSTYYDASAWARLSPRSELFDSGGDHYEWVIRRGSDFAAILKNWLRQIAAETPARSDDAATGKVPRSGFLGATRSLIASVIDRRASPGGDAARNG